MSEARKAAADTMSDSMDGLGSPRNTLGNARITASTATSAQTVCVFVVSVVTVVVIALAFVSVPVISAVADGRRSERGGARRAGRAVATVRRSSSGDNWCGLALRRVGRLCTLRVYKQMCV